MSSSPAGRADRLFEAWAAFAIARRWLVIAVCLGVTVLFGWIASKRLRVDRSATAMVYAQGEDQQFLDRFQSFFGSDDLYLVVIEGDVFSLDFLRHLRDLHEQLAELDVQGLSRTRAESSPPDPSQASAADDFGASRKLTAERRRSETCGPASRGARSTRSRRS